MIDEAAKTVEIPSFKKEHLAKNAITGRNRGETSAWLEPEELGAFLDLAEFGDLLEIERIGFRHWGIYAGRDMNLCGKQEAYILHLGRNTDLSSVDIGHEKSKPTVNLNKLVGVVGTSRIRVNNDKDPGSQPEINNNLINARIRHFVSENMPYHLTESNCEVFAKYCRYGFPDMTDQGHFSMVVLYVILVRNIVYAVDSVAELICATFVVLLVKTIFIDDCIPFFIRKYILGTPSATHSQDSHFKDQVKTDNSTSANSNNSSGKGRRHKKKRVHFFSVPIAVLIAYYAMHWLVDIKVFGVRYMVSVIGNTYTVCVVALPSLVYMVGVREVYRKIEDEDIVAFIILNCSAFVMMQSSTMYWIGLLVVAVMVGLIYNSAWLRFDGSILVTPCTIMMLVVLAILPMFIFFPILLYVLKCH